MTHEQSSIGQQFEKPTDDLRQVMGKVCRHIPFWNNGDGGGTVDTEAVSRVQRRWVVQDGPVQHVMEAVPPDDKSRWLPHPHLPLCWVPIRSEWRDLPAVTTDQLAAEAGNPISTT